MKKIILPALFGVMLLTSCKKDYTCECTNVRTEVGVKSGSETSTNTYKTTYKEVSKKYMSNAGGCYSSESKYSSETLYADPLTGQTDFEPTTVTSVNTCEIKK